MDDHDRAGPAMISASPSPARVRATGPVVTAVLGTVGLAAAAFTLSFTALRDLAILAGTHQAQAWLWPLVVDGVILEATISVVALRNGTGQARRFAWILLTSGAGISVAANIVHALVTADDRVPALVAALVASVPPLTLVAMTHLTVELLRNTSPRPADLSADTGTGAADVAVEDEPSVTSPVAVESAARAITSRPPRALEAARSREERRVLARELAAQQDPKLSLREISRRIGVHPTTVGRWLSAPDGQATEERTDDEPDT